MKREKGIALLTTMIIMAVMLIMAFGATAGSLLQERMSANQRFKILTDTLAMEGVMSAQAWLQLDDEHWGEADDAWFTPQVQAINEGVVAGTITIDPDLVIWQTNEIEMVVAGELQSLEGEVMAETRLRVRFVRAMEGQPVAMVGWSELP
ncbi:PilX N-terminal domain-containing pilus assembly protein [Nitrincola sp. MINF-07-Sa-05]|uniref:PilX N-terminal domain-containing pilus assembly protein n=1 Tax=Nitrincola salilacus TaxID=3400273 RepID=UPI003918083D